MKKNEWKIKFQKKKLFQNTLFEKKKNKQFKIWKMKSICF